MTAEEFLILPFPGWPACFDRRQHVGNGVEPDRGPDRQPLKNARLVILTLLANFVLVPLFAFAITRMIPLEQSLQIGLIMVATTAGAPFLVKEVRGRQGQPARCRRADDPADGSHRLLRALRLAAAAAGR